MFGLDFFIQIKLDGVWHELNERKGLHEDGVWWALLGFDVPLGEHYTFYRNWKTLFGALPDGTYRFVKSVNTIRWHDGGRFYLTYEFTLPERI